MFSKVDCLSADIVEDSMNFAETVMQDATTEEMLHHTMLSIGDQGKDRVEEDNKSIAWD